MAAFREALAGRRAILHGTGLPRPRIHRLSEELGLPVHGSVDRKASALRKAARREDREPRAVEKIARADDLALLPLVHGLCVPSVREDLARLSTPFACLKRGFGVRAIVRGLKREQEERFVLQAWNECAILDNTCPILVRQLTRGAGTEFVGSSRHCRMPFGAPSAQPGLPSPRK